MDLNTFLAAPASAPTPTEAKPQSGFNPLQPAFDSITNNPLTSGLMSIGHKINTGIGRGISALGGIESGEFEKTTGVQLPEEQGGYASLGDFAGQAVAPTIGVQGQKPISLGAKLPGPPGLGFSTDNMSPKAKEYAGAVARPLGSSLGTMTVDPVTYVPFGALVKFGPTGRALGTAISAGFAGQMGMGGYQAAKAAYEEVERSGFSPEAITKATEALTAIGFAGLGAHGAVKHGKMNVADYKNRGGTVERIRRQVAAEQGVPVSALETGKRFSGPQKNMSGHGKGTDDTSAINPFTEHDSAQRDQLADISEVSTIEQTIQPLSANARTKVENALQGSTAIINDVVSKNVARAKEGTSYAGEGNGDLNARDAYEIDLNDLGTSRKTTQEGMPETFGVDASNQAPAPRKLNTVIMNEQVAQELSNKLGGSVSPESLLSETAFEHDGTVYIGADAASRIAHAPDPQAAIQNLIQVAAHEAGHGIQERGPRVTKDVMTGEDLPINDPRMETTDTGHFGGKYADSMGEDVSHGGITDRLAQMLRNHPDANTFYQGAERALSAPTEHGRPNQLVPEGLGIGSNTIEPDVNALIEMGTGRGAGAGGRRLKGGELARRNFGSTPEPLDAETKAGLERLSKMGKAERPLKESDRSPQADAIYEKLKDAPKDAQKAMLDNLVEGHVRAGSFAAYEAAKVKKLVADRLKGKMQPPPAAAAPKAEKVLESAPEVAERPKAEVDAQPAYKPSIKNVPETDISSSKGRTARQVIMEKSNRWSGTDHDERFDIVRKIIGDGGSDGIKRRLAQNGISVSEWTEFTKRLRAGTDDVRRTFGDIVKSTPKRGKGSRELATNDRVVGQDTAETADYGKLPRSSQAATPHGQVLTAMQQSAIEAKKAAQEALKGKDPAGMRAIASSLGQKVNDFLSTIRRSTGWSKSQADAAKTNVTSLQNAQEAALRAADRRERSLKLQKEAADRLEARRKAAEEAATLKAQEPLPKPEPPKVAAKEGRVTEANKSAAKPAPSIMDALNDFEGEGLKKMAKLRRPTKEADPETQRLSADEAIKEAKRLAIEVKDRQANLLAENLEEKAEREKGDKRSIAVRDTDRGGKKSRSTSVTLKGEVKSQGDTIGVAARKFAKVEQEEGGQTLAGELARKGYRSRPQGRKIATQADVDEITKARAAAGLRGSGGVRVGKAIPGTEHGKSVTGRSRKFTPEAASTLGDVQEGRRAGGQGQDITRRADRGRPVKTTTPGKPGVLPQPISEAQLARAIPDWDVLPEEMRADYRRQIARHNAGLWKGAPEPQPATPAQSTDAPKKPTIRTFKEQLESGQTVQSKGKPASPEAQERSATRKAIQAEVDARIRAIVEGATSRRGHKYSPYVEAGKPELSEGKVDTSARTRPAPKELTRKGVTMANDSPYSNMVARNRAYAESAKALLEQVGKKAGETPEATLNRLIVEKKIPAAHYDELTGKNRSQLAEYGGTVTALTAVEQGKAVDIAKHDKGKQAHIDRAVKEGMEMFDMHESQLGADGRLRTSSSNKKLQSKTGTTVRNLVEDFIDGKEIDPDGEYFVNPRERANLKKAIADRAASEYSQEVAEGAEAPPITARESLKERLKGTRPLPSQTVSRGSLDRPEGRRQVSDTTKLLADSSYFKDKYIEKRMGEGMTREEALAKWDARKPVATSYEKEKYFGMETWGDKDTPHRETLAGPQRAQYQGGKGGKPGIGGDVEGRMTEAETRRSKGIELFNPQAGVKRGKNKVAVSAFGVESPTAKAGQIIAQGGAMSKDLRLVLDGFAASAKEAFAPKTGVRKAPVLPEKASTFTKPAGMLDAEAIKDVHGKLRTIAREAETFQDFSKRLDGLIDTLPGTGADLAAFRKGAESVFKRTKRRAAETPLQTADRVLGGEKMAPPPAYTPTKTTTSKWVKEGGKWVRKTVTDVDVKGVTPRAFNSEVPKGSGLNKMAKINKPAPGSASAYEEAGKETRKGMPLNESSKKLMRGVKKVEEVGGVIKTGLTGFDISNPLRNTYMLTTAAMGRNNASRRQLVTSLKEMVQSYSETKYREHDARLRARPIYEAAKKAGLRLSEAPSDHENFIGTDWLGKQIHKGQKLGKYNPVRWAAEIGEKGILGAGRAYTHYQNKIMLDSFEKGMEYVKATSPGGINQQNAREMTDMINMFGSRSKVTTEAFEKAGNIFLFSPQMLKSGAKVMSNAGLPFELPKQFGKVGRAVSGGRMYDNKSVRQFGHQAARSGIAFGASALALMYGAAAANGLNPSIEQDPRSRDFLKLRVGHTTVNPWGPYQQLLVLGAQEITGQEKLRGSGRVQSTSRLTSAGRFLRGKLSPLAGAGVSALEGRDGAGRETWSASSFDKDGKFKLGGRARLALNTISPIMLGDVYGIYQENPAAFATLLTGVASLGMGVQSGRGTKGWIQDNEMSEKDVRVSDEIRRLGIEGPKTATRVGLRGKNAIGQKLYYSLKPDEREAFENEVMPIISNDIDKFISTDRYKKAPLPVQRRMLARLIKRENARYSAAKRLKKTYAGATPVNDWWKDEEE
jgi:hypothetical protein